MSENQIGRLVNEIIEVSENDDIFDTLILLQVNLCQKLLFLHQLSNHSEIKATNPQYDK